LFASEVKDASDIGDTLYISNGDGTFETIGPSTLDDDDTPR
jgi:hypothetical protein